MTQAVVSMLLGVSNGAVYAALALGLVLTYRSSGVINFATSSIALFTTYLYAYLRQGELFSPIPGTPTTIGIGGSLGFWPALMISLFGAALLGLLLHLVVFRRLRLAPPIAKAVASIGISVIIAATITARLGVDGVAVDQIFPTNAWTVFGTHIPANRVYFALTILGVALLLTMLFRFTRFGLATRAAAESEKGAFVSGISPEKIAGANWMISSMVAGLAGILIAPITTIVPTTYSLFLVPALAAAILGGFQHLMLTALAGLAIGMLQGEAANLQLQGHSWVPSSGVVELVPLVLILFVLVARAKPLPSRGALVLRSLGRAPRPHHLTLTTIVPGVVAVIALFVLQNEWRVGLITSLIFGIISLSLVVVTGYAGQVSLAQLSLAGAAGFLLNPLTIRWHVPFPLSPIVAALGAAVIGVVVGLPALRIRGLTVAVVTLTLAYSLEAVWFDNTSFVPSGVLNIPSPKFFGWDLGIGSGVAYPRARFGLLVIAVLVIVALSVAKLRNSRLGYQMLAVRANERSAGAAGIDVTRVKIAAFAIASFIAGIGGALLAYGQGTVSSDGFTALGGLGIFTTAYLAGITSVSGGILAGILCGGGLIYTLIDKTLPTGEWYDAITGILLIYTVIANPEGIVGPAHRAIEARRARGRGQSSGIALDGQDTPRDRSRRPVTPNVPKALTITGLTVRYGGVTAVEDVSLTLPEGRIIGLIGPNGAGKTTLIDALCGLTGSKGTVMLADSDLAGQKPFHRTRAGLGRTFQAIELYDDLTVEENVSVGLTASTGRRDQPPAEVLNETFKLLGLDKVQHRPAGELSQGQRQLVSIARALAGQPKVLLLDEPAGGLDASESRWLADRLRDIRDSGVTILLVDHDMNLVLSLCDQVYVLNFGRSIAAGTPSEIRANPEVTTAYLGRSNLEEVAT